MYRQNQLAAFWRTAFVAALAVGMVQAQPKPFDVVVYGATAGGTMAAIAAAQQGMQVALVEPGRHIGGMVTGGLGRTDMDRQEQVIGGYAREFFERVGQRYKEPVSWTFEPKVAEAVLQEWVAQAKVSVFFGERLAQVEKTGARLSVLQTESGKRFAATVFIDSSYEGDLMKAAGVSYVIGRDNRSLYNESLAGRQDFLPGRHQFRFPVSPRGKDNKLLPYIVPQEQEGQLGEGDRRFQSYCFRLCLTDRPENRLPIPAPPGYQRERYGLVQGYLESGKEQLGLRDFVGISRLPNGKSDINSTGPVSTNLLGAAWEYPEASYARRKEIWNEHLHWAQGLFYFLQNDPSVTDKVRKEALQWGLPKDEFPDTGHWPHQLYVREGRRMVGEYVLTQHDLQEQRQKYDSVGMGGYNIDIREVQWVAHKVYHFPNMTDEVFAEGYVSVPVEPYEIPYRSLLPRQQQCSNLLVTACFSASSVAYASARMESQYMILGQSAGVAAALAARRNQGLVHRIPIDELQRELQRQKQILSLSQNGKAVSAQPR